MKRPYLHCKVIQYGIVLCYICLICFPVAAQTSNLSSDHIKICPLGADNQQVPEGLTIRSIKILGRRGVGPIEKSLDTLIGKIYTREAHDKVIERVESELTNEVNTAFERQLDNFGLATVYTTPCVEIDNISKSIDVIVRVFFIRLDLGNPINNLLTLPRSIKPSFYDRMNPSFRVFNPSIDLIHDRRTGLVLNGGISANLNNLPELWSGKKIAHSNSRLNFNFTGEKSLTKPFYLINTTLLFSKIFPKQFLRSFDIDAGYQKRAQPLSNLAFDNKRFQLGGQIRLRPRLTILNSVYIAGLYSWNDNTVDRQEQQIAYLSDKKGTFRSILDGRLLKGAARLGVWFETAQIKQNSSTYNRLGGILGYQREFGHNTQTVGVEVLVGSGKAWGVVPVYALFYGGNNINSFIYDSPNSISMKNFPVGPLLRSYGKTEAIPRETIGENIGGKAYWHANLSISIPIKGLSRPLIPDETVSFQSEDIKLNQLLDNFTLKTLNSTIADDLVDSITEELMRKDSSLTEDEAFEQARPIAKQKANDIVNKDIAPYVKFIAYKANFFAIKPLLMFDAANIGRQEINEDNLRFSAGAGLQLVLVVVRAELGYMRSISSNSAGLPKGNLIFRITFQNFF